jgi:hypothetical protein
MEIGQAIYYRVLASRYIQKSSYQGETSRSWLIGSQWRPVRLPKKSTVFCSEQDWHNQMWARKHAYGIYEKVQQANFDELKKIADIVKYEDSNT